MNKNSSWRESEWELRADILSYFLDHPRVVDNVEGILRWRLLEIAVRRATDEVNNALTWLVDHEYLRQHTTKASGDNFCLNVDRCAEAKRALIAMRQLELSHEEE